MKHYLTALRARMRWPASLLLLLPLLLLASALYQPTQTHAQTNAWSSASAVTPSNVDALEPNIVIDSGGVSHVVYFTTNFSSYERVYYTNNRGGQWATPTLLSTSNGSEPDISVYEAGGQTTLDIVWGSVNGLFYVRSTDGGRNWTTPNRVTTHPSFDPAIILDNTGSPHVVYTRGGRVDGSDVLDLYYTAKTTAVWTSARQIDDPADAISGESDIHYTMSGNTLVLHVAYRAQRNWGANSSSEIKVNYVRRSGGGGWGRSTLAFDYGGKPDIETNQQSMVFTALTRKVSGYDFEGYVFRSTDHGLNWANLGPVAVRDDKLSRSTGIGRSYEGVIAAVSSDDSNADRNDIFARISLDNGASWSQIAEVFDNPGTSLEPKVGGGPGLLHAVWYDNATGKFRIYNSVYQTGDLPTPTPTALPTSTPTPTNMPTPTSTPTPTPQPVPEGSIRLQGNISYDVSTVDTINIQMTITGGNPDQYRYSNDGINWSELEPIPPTRLVTKFPIVMPPEGSYGCEFRTVRVQYYNSTNELFSEVMEDSIQVDPGVDVDVYVGNPLLHYSLLRITSDVQADAALANVGDPRYTNNESYYGRVTARSTECSGLADVEFSPLTSVTVAGNRAEGLFPLAQDTGLKDGPYEVSVTVTDGVGNTRVFDNIEIYLDRAAPQVSNVFSSTVNILDVTSQPVTTTDSLFVNLGFADVQMTDAGYGEENPTHPFWGVLLANSTDYISPTDTAALQALEWYPFEVATINLSAGDDTLDFEVSGWNVFNGIDERVGGRTQYVYARVVDGAGNLSDVALVSNPFYVADEINTPMLYLPHILK